MQSASVPAKFRVDSASGFVTHAIYERMPRILADVIAVSAAQPVIAKLEALRSQLMPSVSVLDIATAVDYLPPSLAPFAGRSFSDVPFFDFEFAFYEAINYVVGFDGSPERDPYRALKAQAVADATSRGGERLHTVRSVRDPRARLRSAALLALRGNEADLSQLDVSGGALALESGRLIVDELERLVDALAPGASVVVICDNGGAELLADCIFAYMILTASLDSDVTLLCKAAPIFVSDALEYDYRALIARMSASGCGEPMHDLARALVGLERAGRLAITSSVELTRPLHFRDLSAGLVSQLAAADIVVSKGDLNYRRFVEDRPWPLETPVPVACAAIGFSAVCLRVLKSDPLVGISPAVAQHLTTRTDNWRWAGGFSVVQYLGAP